MNKVKLGFFSFTEITHPKEHQNYNEWHQLDHMPEQLPLRGVALGQRWVHTPACRAARVACGPQLEPIHYVTLYLMTEPVDETLREFYALGSELSALGRFHRHRHSHLGGPYRLLKAYAAPRVRISPEALPFRPNRGIFVTVNDPIEPVDPEAVDEYVGWLDQVHYADMLELPGVAGLWTFAAGATLGGFDKATKAQRITVYYLDDDPLAVVAAMTDAAPRLRDAGRLPDFSRVMQLQFAGAFETITPWKWDWFDAET